MFLKVYKLNEMELLYKFYLVCKVVYIYSLLLTKSGKISKKELFYYPFPKQVPT